MTTMPISEDFDFGEAKKDLPDATHAPDGNYVVQITKAESKMSKGAGSKPARPMIAITCSILSGPYAGLPIWHNFVYTAENPAAQRMFYGQLAKLGITQPGKGSEIAAMLKDRIFNCDVGHREYNGVVSNDIQKIVSLQSAGAAGVPTVAVVPNVPTVAAQPVPQVPAAPVTPTADVPQAAPTPIPVPEPVAAGPGDKPPF